MSTRERGREVEDRVARHLEAQGLTIVDRNPQGAGAELDIVARDGEAIVFVEVRSRARDEHGSALDTISVEKQRRIIRGATAWLTRNNLWERVEVRFDVVAVTADQLTWLRNAFDAV